MGVFIFVSAIVLIIVFGAACIVGVAIALDEGDGPLALAALALGLLTLPLIPTARWGMIMQETTDCDAVARHNPGLEVEFIELSFWSFGCYVSTDGATVPWERYRAVVEG